jgi:cell wall-associated NlpC family hydrolase
MEQPGGIDRRRDAPTIDKVNIDQLSSFFNRVSAVYFFRMILVAIYDVIRAGRAARVAATIALALAAAGALAEAPLYAAAPKGARSAVVARAYGYRGSPYVSGGADSSGFDCSGLVFRVYKDALGASLPRTVSALSSYCERIGRDELEPGDLVFFDTTGGLSHVGIFSGEGRFVHSASEGRDTGVIESSLAEAYWSRTYAVSGRLLPPAGYLGIIMTASLGPSLGASDLLRGCRGTISASFRILGLEPGIELRPAWDGSLGVVRVPAVLSIGIDRRLKAYAGPAITLGTPSLDGRAYEPSGGLLAIAGIEYTMLRFRIAGLSFGLTAELEYDRYVAGAGEGSSVGLDAAACVRAGIGLGVRWGF